MERGLHRLKIDENGVWLDEVLLKGVRSYQVLHKENDDVDELTLKMDTTTLSEIRHSNFDSSLQESRN